MFTSRFGNYQVVDEPFYKSEGGVANGVATLDGSGQVPISQLPPALVGAVNYVGTWNANTNTPTLADGGVGGDKGDYFVVNVAGTTTIDGISDWQVGDWIINNGSAWQKVDNTDAVLSVNGLTGAVSLGINQILTAGNTATQPLFFQEGSGDIRFTDGVFSNRLLIAGGMTANYSQTFQSKTGIVAHLSDITTAVANISLNDLTDVSTGLPPVPTIVDDGRYLFYDFNAGEFITKEDITHGTVVINAKKSTAGTIAVGKAVYLAGFNGDVVTVELADNTSSGTMGAIGLATDQLNDTDSNNHVIILGKVSNVDTSAWAVGTLLYVGTAGNLTNVRPTGTNIVQPFAKVLKQAVAGQVKVFGASQINNYNLPNLSTGKVWVGDASGYPIEATLPTGSGTTDFVTRWTTATTLGDSLIRDNGSTLSIGNALDSGIRFLVYGSANNTQTIAGIGVAHPSQNYGVVGVAGAGTGTNIGVRAEAVDLGGGGNVIGFFGYANGLYGSFPASKSIGAQIHANNSLLATGDNYGIQVASVGASAGNNIGIYAYASNSGAGNHWAIQIVDGTQGAGKVLTSDAQGRATWQNAGGGSWTPPTLDLSSGLSNGASTLLNANAGFQKSFSATANDEIVMEFPLYNNGLDYDGSDLQFRIRWQLFNTIPAPTDTVLWELDYVFLADGDDGDSKVATTIVLNVGVGVIPPNSLLTSNLPVMTGLAGAHTLGLTLRRRSSGAGADSYPSSTDLFSFDLIKV